MADLIYFKKFGTKSEYDSYIAGDPVLPNVSIVNDEDVYFKDGEGPEPTPSHDYVEIAGIKWATMNLGATSVTDYGKYYAWGDISGYTASQVGTDKNFDGEDYVFGPIYNLESVPDKYNFEDSKTVLDMEDDAVAAEWGGGWRIPTRAEWEGLFESVNMAWTSNYQGSGVSGIVCTDKIDSTKELFFPAAGSAIDGSIGDAGKDSYFWTNSLHTWDGQYVAYAHYAYFYKDGGAYCDSNLRAYGYSLRGILDE